jgi:hypothetical protein
LISELGPRCETDSIVQDEPALVGASSIHYRDKTAASVDTFDPGDKVARSQVRPHFFTPFFHQQTEMTKAFRFS